MAQQRSEEPCTISIHSPSSSSVKDHSSASAPSSERNDLGTVSSNLHKMANKTTTTTPAAPSEHQRRMTFFSSTSSSSPPGAESPGGPKTNGDLAAGGKISATELSLTGAGQQQRKSVHMPTVSALLAHSEGPLVATGAKMSIGGGTGPSSTVEAVNNESTGHKRGKSSRIKTSLIGFSKKWTWTFWYILS